MIGPCVPCSPRRWTLSRTPRAGGTGKPGAPAETVTLPDGRIRPTATLIHFLLPAGECSEWHRVASDDGWRTSGPSRSSTAGPAPRRVPATPCGWGPTSPPARSPRPSCPPAPGSAPCRRPAEALVGCLVSPGFDFEDFDWLTTRWPDEPDRGRPPPPAPLRRARRARRWTPATSRSARCWSTPTATVLREDRNRVPDGDQTRHPEFELARWAAANLTPEERAAATVYTSGEHCPMCAAAHAWVGLGRIVYAGSRRKLPAGGRVGRRRPPGRCRCRSTRSPPAYPWTGRRPSWRTRCGRCTGNASPEPVPDAQAPASRSPKNARTRSTASCWRCSVSTECPLPSNSTAMKSSPSSRRRVSNRVPVAGSFR